MNTSQRLIATCTQLVQNGTTEIYLAFSTPGGQVMAGLAVYNMLRALPVPVITHNMANIDSIGNAIFLAGAQRLACPHSTFMFHGVGFALPANMQVEEKFLRERLDGLIADQTRIAQIIVERTTINATEARKLFREARTKNAGDALARGIVHEIAQLDIPGGAPIISIII
jgi:ATP-dependent protease ClpP protease subunit